MFRIALTILSGAQKIFVKMGGAACVRWLLSKGVQLGLAMSTAVSLMGFRSGRSVLMRLVGLTKANKTKIAKTFVDKPGKFKRVLQTASVSMRPALAKTSGVKSKSRSLMLGIMGYASVDLLIEGVIAFFEMSKEEGLEAEVEELRDVFYAAVVLELEDMITNGEGNRAMNQTLLNEIMSGNIEDAIDRKDPALMLAIDKAAINLGISDEFLVAVATEDEIPEVSEKTGIPEDDVANMVQRVVQHAGHKLRTSDSSAFLASTLNKDDLKYDRTIHYRELDRLLRESLGEFFRAIGGPESGAAIRDLLAMSPDEYINAVSEYYGEDEAARIASKS